MNRVALHKAVGRSATWAVRAVATWWSVKMWIVKRILMMVMNRRRMTLHCLIWVIFAQIKCIKLVKHKE